MLARLSRTCLNFYVRSHSSQLSILPKHCISTSHLFFASKFKESIDLTFEWKDGTTKTVKADIGDNLLDVVINRNVDIDGFGACEGTLACSTCHLIFDKKNYDSLPNPPSDDEMDMLDLAFDLCETSRLGCQIIVTKDMNGWKIKVPDSVNDARA